MFVYEEHGQSFAVVFRREFTGARLVSRGRNAAHDHLVGRRAVRLEDEAVPSQGAAAPRAVGERKRRRRRLRRAVLVLDDEPFYLFHRIRGGRSSDPKPHRETNVAKLGGGCLSKELESAHERCGATELIERQESERVAKEHRHSKAAVWSRLAAEATHKKREADHAEIRLGLSAACRKEDELDFLAIGVCLVGNSCEVHEYKGELKQAPLRLLPSGVPPRTSLARGHRHRTIHDLERFANRSVRRKQRDPCCDAVACALCVLEKDFSAVLASVAVERYGPFAFDPLLVGGGDWR